VLHFLKDVRLTSVAHRLCLAAKEAETIIELFTLGNGNAHICFAVDARVYGNVANWRMVVVRLP
jgi:hypothetical protein